MAAATAGMERVAALISRCAIYEQLYLTHDVPKDAEEATENLRRGLLTLYTAILQALCRLIRVFEGRILFDFFPWRTPITTRVRTSKLILSTRKMD